MYGGLTKLAIKDFWVGSIASDTVAKISSLTFDFTKQVQLCSTSSAYSGRHVNVAIYIGYVRPTL